VGEEIAGTPPPAPVQGLAPTLAVTPARVDTQECDAAIETTRETKRRAEQAHDAVAADDAHARKIRKTKAGRSAAAQIAAKILADWDAQLDAEEAESGTLQEAAKRAMEAAGL
jgi:hypothetical protein